MSGKKWLILKSKLILIIFVFSSFLMGQAVLAKGDGSGGGQNKALTLVSSSIKNGSANISLKPEIKLTFNKNIVNMSVKDHNLKCFLLQDANGNSIPINLTLADDQVDFAARNDATIKPKNNLSKDTVYSIVVTPGLQSKSGETTKEEMKITFTTEGAKTATKQQSSVNSQSSKAKTKSTANSNRQNKYRILGIVFILMIIVLIFYYLKRKK